MDKEAKQQYLERFFLSNEDIRNLYQAVTLMLEQEENQRARTDLRRLTVRLGGMYETGSTFSIKPTKIISDLTWTGETTSLPDGGITLEDPLAWDDRGPNAGQENERFTKPSEELIAYAISHNVHLNLWSKKVQQYLHLKQRLLAQK